MQMDLFHPTTRVGRPGYSDPLGSRSVGGKASYDEAVSGSSSKYRDNHDDYRTSRKTRVDDRGPLKAFYPITEQWQNEKAKDFNIKVVKSFGGEFGNTKNFTEKSAPSKTIRVEGDGNCFFRAISMCIIGSENEHMRVRTLITKHVEDNPEIYRTFLQSRGGMNQYLRAMRRSREWATDVEILAAATLLKTVIEVYFPCQINKNIEYRWQTFKPLNNENMTYPVIYLSNKNDHFDPVLDICDEDVVDDARTKSVRQSYSESTRTVRDSESHHEPSSHAKTFSSKAHYSSFSNVIPSHPGPYSNTYSPGQKNALQF